MSGVEPALHMRGVTFGYTRTGFGLEVESFAIAPGDAVFLRGPSGSGKTTFLGLATGLLAADEGEVRLSGVPMPARAAARDRLRADAIGIIHQQFNLLPYLDTLSNVLLPLAFGRGRRPGTGGGRTGSGAAEKARALLDRLGVPSRLHGVPARSLSVGQQQRVAIARALLGEPPLVVADEPTSALDTEARDAFLDVLFGLLEGTGSALLMVSHDPAIGVRFSTTLDMNEVARVRVAGDAMPAGPGAGR